MADDLKKQIFEVVVTHGMDDADRRLTELGAPRFQLTTGVWFVAYAGTARMLAEALAVRGRVEDAPNDGVVCPISSYSGRANPELWEWFKVNWPND